MTFRYLLFAVLAWPAWAQQPDRSAETSRPQPTEQRAPAEAEPPAPAKAEPDPAAASFDLGQDSGPRSLLLGPFVPPDAIDVPSPASLVGRAEDESSGTTGGVRAESLDELGPAAIGTLPPGEALPLTLWQASDPAVAAGLLRVLPGGLASPTARRLQRDLLLSPALPPDAGPISDGALYRLDALVRGGRIDDAAALLALIPAAERSGPLRRLEGRILIAGGRLDAACEVARDGLRAEGSAFWLRLVAVCEAIDGNRAAANLQVSLLEETGEEGVLLPRLVDRLLTPPSTADDGPAPPLSFEAVDRLDWADYAGLLSLQIAPPLALAETAQPLMIAELLRSPLMPDRDRVNLARTGLAQGLVDGERLAALFQGVAFEERDLASADLVLDDPAAIAGLGYGAVPLSGLLIDALLYQRVARYDDPRRGLRFAGILLERARTGGYALAMAEALAPALSQMLATQDLADLAAIPAEIFFGAGQPDRAGEWFGLVGPSEAAFARLWPLMFLSERALPAPAAEPLLSDWARRQDLDPARLNLTLALIEALRRPVAPGLWAEALAGAPVTGSHTPSVAVWRQLLIAQAEQRAGEAIAGGLIALGAQGPAQTDPAALSAALSALVAVDQGAAAHRLAVEALVVR